MTARALVAAGRRRRRRERARGGSRRRGRCGSRARRPCRPLTTGTFTAWKNATSVIARPATSGGAGVSLLVGSPIGARVGRRAVVRRRRAVAVGGPVAELPITYLVSVPAEQAAEPMISAMSASPEGPVVVPNIRMVLSSATDRRLSRLRGPCCARSPAQRQRVLRATAFPSWKRPSGWISVVGPWSAMPQARPRVCSTGQLSCHHDLQ